MEERLFDVLYRDYTNGKKAYITGEKVDITVREMKGAIKSKYLEKGGALNELDHFSNSSYGFSGYEAVIPANTPLEAIGVFCKLLDELEENDDVKSKDQS